MEDYLLEYCMPTLTGLKVANLINIKISSEITFAYQLHIWKKALKSFGIHMRVLRTTPSSKLVYIYRKEALLHLLSQTDHKSFLLSCGYQYTDLEYVFIRLEAKLRNCHTSFPHEIGLLLGYPLCDVIGYIENKGQNCLQSGLWRVYDNVEATEKIFQAYEDCKNRCMKLSQSGVKTLDILRLHYGGAI